ncbi:DMT family transporter [Arcticibacter sp. MXS-1]|uniref:DMT family transporter n=1 Tax=Arcticibacter sp. MXS-1 TaxID=3341726 RepID=UPI0035A996E1
MRNLIIPGLLFAALWATGSVAIKYGLNSADPLILAAMRFLGTGLLFGPFYFTRKVYRFWPARAEWKPILIYGLLNTTLTLGSFSASQRYASAGISTLFIAITPLAIAFLSAALLKRQLRKAEIWGMLIAFVGLVLASVLDLRQATIKPLGIALLLIYVFAYAFSSIYFSKIKLSLPNEVFNVWQVFLGGLALLPFAMLFGQGHVAHWDLNLFGSLLWMIIALSFLANQLWLHLLRVDAVAAGTWLYLVPVLGYAYGYLFLHEPVTLWAVLGTVLVIAGLVVSARRKGADRE